MLSCPRCPVVKCVRHRGDDVCCSVVFGTLVGVFSVMWSELLMTSDITKYEYKYEIRIRNSLF